MVKYTCKKCRQIFKRKAEYVQHNQRQSNSPCVIFILEHDDAVTKVKNANINHYEIVIAKPILKWVGGKTQILDKLIPEFPTQMVNYHEIFVGAGSVLFAVLAYRNAGILTISNNVYAYDANEPLIYVFKNIQSNHDELYDEIQLLISNYGVCTEFNIDPTMNINRNNQTEVESMLSKENYYYWARMKYNNLSPIDKQTVQGSALFIFLNKTCFRGLFRVGPNGFNVPYGNYKSPEIINKEHLDQIHDLIQGVIFMVADFTVSMNLIGAGDYAYLDPPYVQESSTSFVSYTVNGFEQKQHNELFDLCNKLTSEHKSIMISNADVDIIREQLSDEKYTITSIECKRKINSKKPESKAKEVIITNY